MKSILKLTATIVASMVILISCGEKKSTSSSEILAGSTSKTWKIAKQIDAHGDKEKLTDAEKDGTLNMYADGRFSIVEEKGTATGKWSVENDKTLVMHFDGQSVTENFAIEEIANDKVSLKAGDGSAMILKVE